MKLLLIDAMNLIRRIYAAQEKRSQEPVEETFLHAQNAVLNMIQEASASHCALVFDGHRKTWRHHLYPDYKADRKPMPSSLADALPHYREGFENLGVATLLYEEIEADDVIATLAVKMARHGAQVRIVSTDKGFMQIVDNNISLYHYFDRRHLSLDDVEQQLGLKPKQLIDYLSLVGDSTNHVPGITGIGPKTAGELLDQYGDLDSILIHSDSIPGKVGEHLRDEYRKALFARKMVTLKTDLALGANLQTLRYQPVGVIR